MTTPPITDQSSDQQQDQSIAQQMLADGSLPDKPVSSVPMRAVVAASSTLNPDKEAQTQQLAQQAGMGVDLTRANPQAAQQRAVAADLDRRDIEIRNPILARQLSDPSFAAVAHDDLDSLSRIEQGAAVLRAPTLGERIMGYEYSLNRALMNYPLTRYATDLAGGALDLAGDAASFFGLHGSGPTRENWLQRQAQNLTPEKYGLEGNQFDALVRNVGPVLATMPLSAGTSLVARTLGLSENAAKALTALGVGSAFTASQGGRTFTQMAAAGKPDDAARHDADVVAAINAVPNMAMGLTDFVPGLRDYPLLSALGIGGATGAAGQLAQNRVTGQPLTTDLAKGAIEGAAVQGGMHLGFNFLGQMSDMVDALESSKLRTRQPAAFQQFTNAVFDGDPSVRVPAQEFVDYFAKKSIDPAVMAHELGATNLEEAAAAGSDLEIPKANFFGKLDPEHQKGLLPDVVDPATDMTARQDEAGRAELKDWVANGGVEKLVSEFQQADAETQATPEWQQVKSDLKQRYVDAGETEPVAENYATLQANAISYFAKNTGMKPDEVLALHNPQIVEGEAPESAAAAARNPYGTPEPAEIPLEMKDGTPFALRRKFSGKYEAFNQSDERIGSFSYGKYPDGTWKMFGAEVEPKYQRKGVATAAYDAIEKLIGDKFQSTGSQSAMGQAFWEARENNEAALKPGEPLYQGGGDRRKARNMEVARLQGEMVKAAQPEAASEENRGWFRMRPDGSAEIGKTKIGDFSTFIHEPAHGYLELFRTMTQRGDASDQLKADFSKICEWLGTTPEEVQKNGFTREQHEQWARGTEQYVREGNAPTSALRRAFNGFGVWLQRIYRQARALGVEMSPDIHGVMDRLYAGEHAVDRADRESPRQQLFEKPEDAGLTDEELRNYADAHDLETDEAKAQVLREMNEAVERERTQDWRDEFMDTRDAITQQVDARPEYRAIRALRRGAIDDTTPMTLNRDALVKQFGEERVKALQQLHRGLYRNEGGTDAETAAELLGFGSGEEMLRAIENAPRRGQAIDAATRDYLINKHGDVRYDGTLDDRARFALENNERARNIYREVRTLRAKVALLEKKAADSKAAMAAITVEPLDHYQGAARQMIDQKAPADLQPHRYLDASRKYSREAFDALRKGNVRRAAEAKNKELLNHFLFREASDARDWAEKFEKYVQRVQSKGIQQRLGLAGSDYRDQFNWLMARYKLGPGTPAPERSLREWAEDVYSQGNEPAIAPGILNENRFADYRGVPMSELRDVHDALVNIRHLAQQQFKMYVQGKQVAFAEARTAMVSSARENLKTKPENIFEENRSRTDKLTSAVQWADARLMRMERLIEWLDGGKSGPWHDNLWNLAADAQGDEYALQEDVTRHVTDALANMPDEMRRRLWTEKVSVDGVSEPLTRRRMLSIALNMGNDGNLDRLRKTFDSFGWDREAISRIGGMLTHEEWQFVQKTWDSLKPLGERANELTKRLTGLPLGMVKVTPFKVALDDGTEMDLAGGYFPIVMDPRFSQRAIEQDSKESAQNAMQAGYVRATTSKGYTKERTGFGGPLLLDYEQAMTSHVAKVAKDLSHREFMLSSQKLLLDTEVRKTLRETLGPRYEEQFMPWLRTIINDNNGSVQERLDGFKDGMQKLRGNIVAGSLGFNFSTSLLQLSHAPRMLLYARPASLVQSLVHFLAGPVEATREIRDLSPNEMRFRGDNLDRDVRAVLQNPSYQSGYTRKVAVAARFSLEVMDHLLSHTLWRAAFNDAMGKYGDLDPDVAQEKAVHEADSAVRLGLGTSAPKDLPAIMRSNEFNKFITTLYGFHSGVYNQLRDIGHQFRYDHNVGKLTAAGILTVVLPSVLGSWLTGQRPKDGENPGWWAAKQALLFSADTVPLLRSAASAIEGGHDVQFSPIESVITKGAKAAMEATSGKEDKDWMGIGLNEGEAAGALLGVPGSHQAVKTMRYIHRANEGKIENPNLWGALVGGR